MIIVKKGKKKPELPDEIKSYISITKQRVAYNKAKISEKESYAELDAKEKLFYTAAGILCAAIGYGANDGPITSYVFYLMSAVGMAKAIDAKKRIRNAKSMTQRTKKRAVQYLQYGSGQTQGLMDPYRTKLPPRYPCLSDEVAEEIRRYHLTPKQR